MNFQVKKLGTRILHLVFNSDELMCKTMCRFGEHYESPAYRNKVFTWRQFRSWYKWDKGSFSYYTDWGGYNMPSRVFAKFQDGSFDPLTFGEKAVLEAVKGMEEPFYVIATSKESDLTLRHEVAHAFYSTYPDYNEEVLKVLSSLPEETNDILKAGIKLAGYNDEVLHDELHAYLVDGIKYLSSEVADNSDEIGYLDWCRYWLAGKRLNRILNHYMKKHGIDL